MLVDRSNATSVVFKIDEINHGTKYIYLKSNVVIFGTQSTRIQTGISNSNHPCDNLSERNNRALKSVDSKGIR